ncbi:MAG: peroxidase family protein, partial [Streptosporangiaceae bacterium]
KIDTTLSSVLFNLLGRAPGSPTSLATRNLLRNLTMEVPSGQSVARAMSLPALAPGDLSDLQPLNLQNRTPLWFYVLREAQLTAGGEHLGPVGGRIVAEVIYGLIKGDSQSYLGQDPQWTPTYGKSGAFTIVDLLTKSGIVAKLA